MIISSKEKSMRKRNFFDTEFQEDGRTIELISIGIANVNGDEYYAEVESYDWNDSTKWLRDNVLPGMKGGSFLKSRETIASEIIQFVSPRPEFWAYYCVAPDTRILTHNLSWVAAGSLVAGDGLVGFDEFPGPGRGRSSNWRKWKKAAVESSCTVLKPCYRLKFDDGTEITCSSDHGWLTSSQDGAKWTTTKNMVCTKDVESRVIKPLSVWEPDVSYGGGYLAAAFDGEGHLTQTDLSEKAAPAPCCFRIGFNQKPNVMLERVKALLEERGFHYTEGRNRLSGVHHIYIAKHDEALRFLGTVRPLRLLNKFDPSIAGAMRGNTVRLVCKEFIGDREVIAIKTSSRTFIAEGLASHNCSYDWVVLCQLYGTMLALPEGWPMYCLDLKQELLRSGDPRVPKQEEGLHSADADARWVRDTWLRLQKREKI